MPVTSANSSVPLKAITTYRLVNAIESVLAAGSAWNAKRKTRKALANLTDSQLDDIGLSRAGMNAYVSHINGTLY